jgi:DNA-binding response OmpR family regulator
MVQGMAMFAQSSTVLIVDDDALIRAAAQAILVRQGHETRVAEDGDVALATMAAEPAQIVLLDILMPRKEGLETLIELRRAFPATIVVAMSASLVRKRNDFLAIAVKFGADSILRKPFTPDGLLAAIAGGVAHRAQAQRAANV